MVARGAEEDRNEVGVNGEEVIWKGERIDRGCGAGRRLAHPSPRSALPFAPPAWVPTAPAICPGPRKKLGNGIEPPSADRGTAERQNAPHDNPFVRVRASSRERGRSGR